MLSLSRIKPGGLSHPNQDAGGASRGLERITNQGVPDRRYGPWLRRTDTADVQRVRGVVGTALAVLAMAALGALLWWGRVGLFG